jgi:hypothetical protein
MGTRRALLGALCTGLFRAVSSRNAQLASVSLHFSYEFLSRELALIRLTAKNLQHRCIPYVERRLLIIPGLSFSICIPTICALCHSLK